MSRPDNWGEWIRRQCVNCIYCEYLGGAMFYTVCKRTHKTVESHEQIGCHMFSDGKEDKSEDK